MSRKGKKILKFRTFSEIPENAIFCVIVTFRNFRSAADRAGLCQGDRLVEVNEKNVETLTYEELTVEIASW